MSDHSIVIDMRHSGSGRFECNAAPDAPCRAVWDCECESSWRYRTIDGKPAHDSTFEGTESAGNEVHIGRFDPEYCDLTDWYDNQEECVDGTVRVAVSPVNEIDYVTFVVTGARKG